MDRPSDAYLDNIRNAYLELHKACGLKVGDKVQIVRAPFMVAAAADRLYPLTGIPGMKSFVGTTGVIISDNGSSRFSLEPDTGYNWPFYCLELVEGEAGDDSGSRINGAAILNDLKTCMEQLSKKGGSNEEQPDEDHSVAHQAACP